MYSVDLTATHQGLHVDIQCDVYDIVSSSTPQRGEYVTTMRSRRYLEQLDTDNEKHQVLEAIALFAISELDSAGIELTPPLF